MRMVIVESPFAGEVERNRAYAIRALGDCLARGEAPFASHLLYTLALDDGDDMQRDIGIAAGLSIAERADATVVYADHGISPGMRLGMEHAHRHGRSVEVRFIGAQEQP